jgi:hypothetical protein
MSNNLKQQRLNSIMVDLKQNHENRKEMLYGLLKKFNDYQLEIKDFLEDEIKPPQEKFLAENYRDGLIIRYSIKKFDKLFNTLEIIYQDIQAETSTSDIDTKINYWVEISKKYSKYTKEFDNLVTNILNKWYVFQENIFKEYFSKDEE